MKIGIPLARDLVMLSLGSVGMVNELFIVEAPRQAGLVVSTLLLMGPGFIAAAWQAYNAGRRPTVEEGAGSRPSVTRGPDTSPSSVSSSPPSQ